MRVSDDKRRDIWVNLTEPNAVAHKPPKDFRFNCHASAGQHRRNQRRQAIALSCNLRFFCHWP